MADNITQLVSPSGSVVDAGVANVDTLKSIGYREQTPDELQQKAQDQFYSSPQQQILTGIEGAAEGALGPIGTTGALALGANPEDMRARAEHNPGISTASKIGGFLGSAVTGEGLAPALTGAGHAIAGESLVGRLAAESAILQGGDEVSKMLREDPHQTAGSAAVNIGMSGLIGMGLGDIGEAISPLWKATVGDKAGQVISDFNSRLNYHLNNPDPVNALHNELSEHYQNITGLADEVYGPQGLKAQDIAKSVPQELTPEITGQAQNLSNDLNAQIDKMVAKPYNYPPRLAQKLQADVANFNEQLANAKNPADYFNAIQDVKQTMQGYSKFDKFIKPIDEEYAFVKDAKTMARSLREGLEDSDIWGDAGKRQEQINSAFNDYLPALKDFNSRFTSQLNGERIIDPTKISTYINQLGKPNAEIKQRMLENFLDASEKYKNQISKIHENLGLDSPIQPSSLATARTTLNEITPGARLADIFVQKGLSQAAGRGLGAATGAMAGRFFGAPGIGALIGEHALGPFFSSVLPALAKPILGSANDAAGLRSAIDYSLAATKGAQALDKAVANTFRVGAEVVPNSLMPKEKDLLKLDNYSKSLAQNPESMMNAGANTNHYMPDHTPAIAANVARSSSFINNARPSTSPAGLTSPPRVPSEIEQRAFKRVLELSEQPLLILKSAKDGTITPQDMMTMGSVHPELLNNIKQKALQEMTKHLSKGKVIPFPTKVGITMLTGEPIDVSLTPQNMQANAQVFQLQNAQQGQKQGISQAKEKGLTKMSTMESTPNQSREQSRTVRK